jgi:hypothetical protein
MAKAKKVMAAVSKGTANASVFSTIHLTGYNIKLNVVARRQGNGKHTPEVYANIVLTGTNQSAHSFTRVDVRLREMADIVTNPAAGADDTFVVDMPITDYAIFTDLLARTIDATAPAKGKAKPRLILQYNSTANVNEFHIVFGIQ